MKGVTLSAILSFLIYTTNGQNLIGYTGKEIRNYMKENHRDMNSTKVINDRYSYLKYINSSDSQTLLFFINKDSVCTSIRLICDQNTKEDKIKEFNSAYKNHGKNRWIDNHDGKDFLIELKDEEWSCTISIEPHK